MAWTAPPTFSTGQLMTAALANAQWRDNPNLLATSIDTATGKLSGNWKNVYGDVPTPAISGGTLTIDCAAGNVIKVAFNANITTTTLQNIPATGKKFELEIYLVADGNTRTWAWLTSTVLWDNAVQPNFIITNNHVMRFFVSTIDGGTTWRGVVAASNYSG
jgi:hypothetical protein